LAGIVKNEREARDCEPFRLSPWRVADVQASENLLVHSPDGIANVIEGLITGIGFIGGGAILKQGNSVHGTATAAGPWATGAIGVSVRLGSFDVAIAIAVFTFLTLKLLTLVKDESETNDIKRRLTIVAAGTRSCGGNKVALTLEKKKMVAGEGLEPPTPGL
jgi:uncharacterized membrane protein YhiD involved in acid resistance